MIVLHCSIFRLQLLGRLCIQVAWAKVEKLRQPEYGNTAQWNCDTNNFEKGSGH